MSFFTEARATEMAVESARLAAECARLRGLLSIARDGLGAAAKDIIDGRTGPHFAFNAYEALRNSDPDASPRGCVSP